MSLQPGCAEGTAGLLKSTFLSVRKNCLCSATHPQTGPDRTVTQQVDGQHLQHCSHKHSHMSSSKVILRDKKKQSGKEKSALSVGPAG